MSSAVSLEYLQSIEGVANGLATLDGSGTIPASQLPAGTVETWKGVFATPAALTTAYAVGAAAWYAWVTSTTSTWAWNFSLGAWVNTNVSAAAYLALSVIERASIVPDYNIVVQGLIK